MIRREVCATEQLRWVDITAPERLELHVLADEFGLPATVVEDCLDPEHLPKIERLGDATFVIVRVRDRLASDDAGSIQELTRKVSLFFKPGLLLTIHRADLEELAAIRDSCTATQGDGTTQAAIIADIIRRTLDSFEKPLERSEQMLDTFEAGLFDEGVPAPSLQEAYNLKRRVSLSRRILYQTSNVLQKLIPPGERGEPLFQDMRESADAYLFWVDQMLEEVNLLLQIHLAMSSKRTNEVMRVLTVFSAFFLPLTFIVGIYGMNFQYMPELAQHWGYPAVLVAMAGISLTIWLWFRRRGWMG
ncbi:MAG TPA: CorA family divalent cation transporter [Gemmatimonadales bacterium]|nr:CorA family divalent cation transporter [Gemmatimonadales bacterium]